MGRCADISVPTAADGCHCRRTPWTHLVRRRNSGSRCVLPACRLRLASCSGRAETGGIPDWKETAVAAITIPLPPEASALREEVGAVEHAIAAPTTRPMPLRVLFTTSGGVGNFNPLVPLALALRDRGHDVAFVAPTRFHPVVAAAGFEALPNEPSACSANTPTSARAA
jgi:hypothetical protein